MPRDFGWRWLLWLAWCNALTIICTMQVALLQITMPDPSTPQQARPWIHWVLTAVNILGIIAAQIKRNNPPLPPPLQKDPNK
jgi:hypothetical protein